MVHGKDLLLRSWEALRAVETLNVEITACVLYILAETSTVSMTNSTEIPSLIPDYPPSPCRPTAAHPRAFRGTKHKPPKHPKPELVNLHQCLCSIAEEGRLLARLAPFLEDAIKLVKRNL